MATLADLLRAGYKPPTESALADPIKEHFRTLPKQLATNQAAMNKSMGGMFKTDMATGQPNLNYYPEAVNEMTMLGSGMAGTIGKALPRKELISQQIEKIAPDEYRGSHVAPNYKTYGAPFYALDELIPKDVYSQQGKRLYGIGDSTIDHEWYLPALKAKGKPDALIEVYRAVPKGVKDINSGDWVTTSKKYATNHGENTLNGEYEIISKKVKANTLSSEGYPYELGYHD
jgi:hypothetical protein